MPIEIVYCVGEKR